MKILMVIITVVITACTNRVNTEKHGHANIHIQDSAATALQLNNGNKWKADEATRNNVADMVQVINDSKYANASNRSELSASLQDQLDSLVKQCSMKGADHDALHVWLDKVMKDMKELKDEDVNYREIHALLKKDVEGFYAFFE